MLPIVIAEQAIENGRVAIDENSLDAGKDKCLIGISNLMSSCHSPPFMPSAGCHT